MITKNDSNDKKTQIQMISLDQLIPEEHILRKIDRYIDFSFIYELVEMKEVYAQRKQTIERDLPPIIKLPLFLEKQKQGMFYMGKII